MLETSPYLLGLTVAVSILHSVFEFLAFKNGALLSVAKELLRAVKELLSVCLVFVC